MEILTTSSIMLQRFGLYCARATCFLFQAISLIDIWCRYMPTKQWNKTWMNVHVNMDINHAQFRIFQKLDFANVL